VIHRQALRNASLNGKFALAIAADTGRVAKACAV